MQFIMLSRLVAHPCLKGLSSVRTCEDFLCAEAAVIYCHLDTIPCSLEFLFDIFWIGLSLFQICILQVKAGKGAESRMRLRDITIPLRL